jgi:hypothetical protein
MDLAQLNNPLIAGIAGLSIGLVLCFFVMVKEWFSRRSLEKENASLIRGHIMMHDTGHKTLSAELEELKRKNENLRVTIATLRSKTEKVELRTLYIYDHAIRLMNARAPGFAPVWESALAEAEAEMHKVDTGMVAWIRRTIRPSLANKPSPVTLPSTISQPSLDPIGSSVNGTHATSVVRPNPSVNPDTAR